jgi:threonine/homoserine/homoserine lactone efflux protein
MESIAAFLGGIPIGIILAIPVGPIALLCMRRTLERGPMYGFATGLGAALADTIYGGIAVFGIAAFSGLIHEYTIPLRLVGGMLMLVLALRLARKKMPRADCEKATTSHKISALISGLFLTLSNPMVIFGFAAVFTGLGIGTMLTNREMALMLVLGIGVGSTLWWFILTVGVMRVRHLLSEKAMHRINLIASALLAIFGLIALGSVVHLWLLG